MIEIEGNTYKKLNMQFYVEEMSGKARTEIMKAQCEKAYWEGVLFAINDMQRELQFKLDKCMAEEAKKTELEKRVKFRLIELNKKQNWLIEEIHRKTGLYVDTSYLLKIMRGTCKSPKIVAAISEILDISIEE